MAYLCQTVSVHLHLTTLVTTYGTCGVCCSGREEPGSTTGCTRVSTVGSGYISLPSVGQKVVSVLADGASPPAELELDQAKAVEGHLEGVVKGGAAEAVDDGVQGTVHVGERDGDPEERGQQVEGVRFTVQEECSHTSDEAWHEAEDEYSQDDLHCPDGPPHSLHLVHLPVPQNTDDAEGAEK